MRIAHLFALLLALTVTAQTAAQTVINVPAQQPTILAAILSASSGDTILVAPGNYNVANINFLGKDVHLRSSGGAASTIIDALGTTRVFVFDSGETSAATVEGFTIMGGSTTDGQDGTFANRAGQDGGDGAGIRIVNSSPTFIDCVICANNTGDGGDAFDQPSVGDLGFEGGRGGHGAGVYIDGGSPTFSNCAFKNNGTGDGGAGFGSGFAVGTVNTDVPGGPGGDGAGVFLNAGTPTFTNCSFDSNSCGNGGNGSDGNSLGARAGAGAGGGRGAGISILGGTATVDGSDFNANESGDGGNAGTTVGDDAGPGGDGGAGAAVFCGPTGTFNAQNCRFTGNVCGDGGEGGGSGQFFAVIGNPGVGGFGGAGGAIATEGNGQLDACTFFDNDCGNGGIGGQGFGVPSGIGGFGGSGGAIVISGGVNVITNAVLAGNTAGDGNLAGPSDASTSAGGSAGVAGGVLIFAGAASLTNCTITANDAGLAAPGGAPGLGGGVFLFGGTLDVSNSIVYGNTANTLADNIFDLGSGTLTVSFCDVEGSFSGPGNFDADPLFVDAANRDFHLTLGSPCRDAGNDTFGLVQATDFEGDPRIVCNALDVGADEFADMTLSNGQAPRLGLAVLDINNATNDYGCAVSSEEAGPYKTTIAQGANFNFDFEGNPWQPVILMYGNLNTQSATYPAPIGQFDIGGTPDAMGIPQNIVVFGDGTTTYLPNNGMITDLTGVNSYPYVMPATIPLGTLTTFQAAIFFPGGVSITNAVQIDIAP